MMKPLIQILTLFTIIMVGSKSIIAQATPTPNYDSWTDWTIERACANTLTSVPDGWTFNGTLFTIDYEGKIRALRADFPTTYFISQGGNDFTYAAAVSPDGKWLAVPHGNIETNVNMIGDSHYSVEEIRLYHTTPDAALEKQFNYEATYLYVNSFLPEDRVSVQWFDNQLLIVDSGEIITPDAIYDTPGKWSIYIATGKVELVTEKTMFYRYQFLSPDLTRIIAAHSIEPMVLV